MTEEESALLVAVGSRQDSAAFERLCELYADRVLGFFGARGVRDPESAAQEVMLTVWRKAHRYDPAKASPATWIFTIARNRSIDLHRQGRRPTPDAADPSFVEANATVSIETPEGALERAEQADAMARALEGLPEEQREVLRLVYGHGETIAAAAQRLGTPLGTAKSRIPIAINALRRRLNTPKAPHG